MKAISTVVTILSLLTAGTAFAAEPMTLQISKYRFRRHDKGRFERLVLEFQRKQGSGKAQVTLSQSGDGVRVKVNGATIMGGIPESAINESYSERSIFLGGISVETENPRDGFTVTAILKDPTVKAEAFWLTKPDRLVLDAYPRGVSSPKSQLGRRNTSSVRRHARRTGKEKIYCFPANKQVGLSVLFRPKARQQDSRVRIDLEASPTQADSTSDAIVCYPASAQVEPAITYHDGQYLTPVPVKPAQAPAAQQRQVARKQAEDQSARTEPASLPRITLPRGKKTEKQANPASLLPPMK